MELKQVLRMNGGDGETSFANNSSIAACAIYIFYTQINEAISKARSIMEEAITALYLSFSPSPSTIAIADLGCSSGPNTLLSVSVLIKTVEDLRKERSHYNPLEFQVFLNDLAGNDFNALFKALPKTQENQAPCFFSGNPGSFYDRLFPRKSLHFVHSSFSLMWLSQVPEGLSGNKGNIYMSSTSPRSIIDAYYQQFQNDFSSFLKHRAQEVVPGGRMVLTILGRRIEDPSRSEPSHAWELLAIALNQMVSEGLIEEEKLETFNIPQYHPSESEVKAEVLKEGSFSINHLVASEVSQQKATDNKLGHPGEAYSFARCMRGVSEPLLVSHFGQGIIEDVFHRYRLLTEGWAAKEKIMFISVTVSLTRKATSDNKE